MKVRRVTGLGPAGAVFVTVGVAGIAGVLVWGSASSAPPPATAGIGSAAAHAQATAHGLSCPGRFVPLRSRWREWARLMPESNTQAQGNVTFSYAYMVDGDVQAGDTDVRVGWLSQSLHALERTLAAGRDVVSAEQAVNAASGFLDC